MQDSCKDSNLSKDSIREQVMRRPIGSLIAIIVLTTALAGIAAPPGGSFIASSYAQTNSGLLQGSAAFGDWHADRPGTRRLIKPQDIPQPDQAQSASNT